MRNKILQIGFRILFLIAIYYVYLMIYRQKVEPFTWITQTNTEAVLFDPQKQAVALTRYEKMYQAMADYVLEEDLGMMAIPGMKRTRTLDSDEGDKICMCTSMTPQGICVTEEYVLISAYCHTNRHNSVIYVMDKHTKTFVKELVLEGKKHVGGLAYDTSNRMIWVSTGYSGHAEVSAFPMEAVYTYDLDKIHAPIGYEREYELYTLKKDSFMTYADGSLYIGHFALKETSVVQKFKINEDGGLKVQSGFDFGVDQDIAIPEDIRRIPARIQGMAVYKDKVMLTQSYGWSPSRLYVYEYSDFMHETESENVVNMIDMPQKLEQIYIDGDDLYVLFESAAYAYRAQPLPKVDHVCKLRLDHVLQAETF